MATKSISKIRINDQVLIAASMDSIDAKHNGKVGRITGFVRDWFVIVKVNGEDLRLHPQALMICS
jgi:hypothetical protein